jgi:hypothetical protein
MALMIGISGKNIRNRTHAHQCLLFNSDQTYSHAFRNFPGRQPLHLAQAHNLSATRRKPTHCIQSSTQFVSRVQLTLRGEHVHFLVHIFQIRNQLERYDSCTARPINEIIASDLDDIGAGVLRQRLSRCNKHTLVDFLPHVSKIRSMRRVSANETRQHPFEREHLSFEPFIKGPIVNHRNVPRSPNLHVLDGETNDGWKTIIAKYGWREIFCERSSRSRKAARARVATRYLHSSGTCRPARLVALGPTARQVVSDVFGTPCEPIAAAIASLHPLATSNQNFSPLGIPDVSQPQRPLVLGQPKIHVIHAKTRKREVCDERGARCLGDPSVLRVSAAPREPVSLAHSPNREWFARSRGDAEWRRTGAGLRPTASRKAQPERVWSSVSARYPTSG